LNDLNKEIFEQILDKIASVLTNEARSCIFTTSKQFEDRVREVAKVVINDPSIKIDFDPRPQAFPDIAVGEFGIEVKFTTGDSWRSVANSVMETNRIDEVKFVYLMFGKMGGEPEVKWGEYNKCVMHVRTSHVPRFEVEIGAKKSLFEQMGVTYDEFRSSDIHEKMTYIRLYARSRLKQGERLWWLEDADGEEHSVPIQARLYTTLDKTEKTKLRAEAILLCPQIVNSSGTKRKYDDVALYLLTYHGVLCHQTRDLFSAGSVANPSNDDDGGNYVERALKLMENELKEAALRMDISLFEEYWGDPVIPENRIKEWLIRADSFAKNWIPSEKLFLE
jgi:hypothetical protein